MTRTDRVFISYPSVLDLRPINREVEIRIIRLFVTLNTGTGGSNRAVSFAGIAGVLFTWAVTLFALDIGKLWRR